ncbi:MAG TPA: hypothetical protein VK066_30855 [Chloroflexota bacterium]|nr:hypothetical protein [Chloroflexota bacterium]
MSLAQAVRRAPPQLDDAPGQTATPPSRLQLSSRGYWLLVSAVLVAYLALWLTHFQYVYGFVMDDYYDYTKGIETVQDWRQAFLFRYNALQPYFYLVSYPPLALGATLPSFDVPLLEGQVGAFRFLQLYTVFLHAILLAVWAWFLYGLTRNRLIGFVAVLLFSASPTLLLWAPKPDSRLLGLPFILVGLWVLLRVNAQRARARRWTIGLLFLGGSLLGLGASIHYTSLYLVAPACLIFAAVWMWGNWRRREAWLGLVSLALGAAWLQVLLEGVSHFVLGLPWEQGPTLSLFNLREEHASVWSIPGAAAVWGQLFLDQLGPLLLAVVVVGWIGYLRRSGGTSAAGARSRPILGWTVALGLAYLGLSGSAPFFRQTSVLQPFLYLFAAAGSVWLAAHVPGHPRARAGALIAILGLILVVPTVQSRAVFQGHQALGEALAWAYAHKGDRPLAWIPMEEFDTLGTPAALQDMAPNTWVIGYFPWGLVSAYPSLARYLQATPPVAAWPTLYATDALWAEARGFGHNDLRDDPLLRDVRIVEAGPLVAALRTPRLAVRQVTADSSSSPASEPVNVFDHDASPDRVTGWASAPSDSPHYLDVQFVDPVTIGALDVVLPPGTIPETSYSTTRIDALDIQTAVGQEGFRTVWRGQSLQKYPVIAARWDPGPATSLRLLIHRAALPTGPTRQAAIEEVIFPGYQVAAALPSRPFPDLVLTGVHLSDNAVVASGDNLTPQTVLVLDGTPLPTRMVGPNTVRAALPPADPLPPGTPRQVYLTDNFRRSQALDGPPVLTRVEPASTPVETVFAPQADGTSTLRVDGEHLWPGTTVTFDSVALDTTYQGPQTLTATLPASFLDNTGHHRITLTNVLGESAPFDFVVTEKTTVPPVLRQLSPASVLADTPVPGRPDGSLELQVTADELTRSTTVLWDGVGLPTTARDDRTIVAQVPAQFLLDPGRHAVTLRNSLGDSNPIDFVVAPKTTNPPRLIAIQPPSTEAGAAFGAKPDGSSTLRVEAADLTRDTVVVFDNVTLQTEQLAAGTLTASIPRDFLTLAGDHTITLRNGQGTSNAIQFAVTPRPAYAPILVSLQPSETQIDTPFNQQPDGTSTLILAAEHAVPGTTAMFDNIALPTTVESERVVRASVPQEFLSEVASHRIVLRNANGESDPLEFVVVAKPAQPPVLNGLQPADTPVDTPFSEQPDGTSLLTLDVEHAVPGAVVLFDGVTLPTTVQTDTVVTAAVPRQFLAYPASHQIILRTPDGESAALPFTVTDNAAAPPVLRALDPAATAADTPFAVQADGTSALRVAADGATPQTVVLWGTSALPTQYLDEHTLLASVPREFLAYPSSQPIKLHNSHGDSNSLPFAIEP